MNLGAITKPLQEKVGALTEILQETLNTLREIKDSNNLIVTKLEVLNETMANKDSKDK